MSTQPGWLTNPRIGLLSWSRYHFNIENTGANFRALQPKSFVAAEESKAISFSIRSPITDVTSGKMGFANIKADFQIGGGRCSRRRRRDSPSKIRPTISR